MADPQPPTDSLSSHRVRDFADRSIKSLLSHRTLLEQLLKNSLKPPVLERLDCSKAQPQKTDFIDPRWRKRFADVFWLIPWRDEPGSSPALVGVLIEHQSEPDWLMPLRILIYIVRFWERQFKQWEDRKEPKQALKLSAIIPIVLSTSSRTWKGPRTLRQLLKTPKLLETHIPDWESIYWELSQRQIEDLKASSDELMQALAAIRASGMKFDVFREAVYNAAEHLLGSTTLGRAERHEILEMLLGLTHHRRTKKEWESIAAGLEDLYKSSPETMKMLRTHKRSAAAHYEKVGFAKGEKTGFEKGEKTGLEKGEKTGFEKGEKTGFEKGEKTGFEKGEKTGFEKGELRAARRLLIRVLERKFGSLSPETRRQIEDCASIAVLENAAADVVVMSSIDELQGV